MRAGSEREARNSCDETGRRQRCKDKATRLRLDMITSIMQVRSTGHGVRRLHDAFECHTITSETNHEQPTREKIENAHSDLPRSLHSWCMWKRRHSARRAAMGAVRSDQAVGCG